MRLLSMCLTISLALPGWGQDAARKSKVLSPAAAPDTPLRPRERAEQMLSRFTYGARPGDVEQVMTQGVDAWFEQQLTPEKIPDDVLEHRLNDYPTIRMTPGQALLVFPDKGTVKQVADGKRPYPADPLLASAFQVQVFKMQTPYVEMTEEQKDAAKKVDQATASRIAGELITLPKRDRMLTLLGMPVLDRIAFADYLAGDQKNILMADFTPHERETVLAMQGRPGTQSKIRDELQQAHVLRQILSERQLQEMMTDFWFNHFNVYLTKDSDQWYTTSYERDSIRSHALGKFRDLLLATAESPAMMIYLDNALSIGPNSVANGVNPANPKAKKGNQGLNENYGREVMELHTLGVNGGYTQADVTSLAAILTGWGVDTPGLGGPFLFDAKKHEPGTKVWFGYSISEDGKVTRVAKGGGPVPAVTMDANVPVGMRQGVAALSILAAAPQTAHFISFLLAQSLVADEPPPALVDRMAKSYLASDGDIKAVLRTLVKSPEFNSHHYARNKVKTPQEFLASAFRATATDPQNPAAIVNKIRELGQPLYQKLEPTGYYVTADHWMNTGALVERLNFADQLTHNKFQGQKFDSSRVLSLALMADRGSGTDAPPVKVKPVVAASGGGDIGPDIALRVLEETLIGVPLSERTDKFIRGQIDGVAGRNPTDTLNLLTALLLGSPEFQVR